MGTKVELHQFINHAVDIHDSKSTVNYVYLNRVLHELAKHMGISNMEVNSGCMKCEPYLVILVFHLDNIHSFCLFLVTR